jgi:bifunctional oligoribonuclease and PAP phosphatase NrnA
MNPEFNTLLKNLETGKPVVIVTHPNPDGDAMGSSLGLYHFLKKKGYDARVITPNEFPAFLGWLPGSSRVSVFSLAPEPCRKLIAEAGVIFCLDFNTLKRVGPLGELIESAGAFKALIDHHREPDAGFGYSLHDINASSTCELVFDFISLFGEEKSIDPEIGICIYTGIMTDTASFRFPAAGPKTHRVAAFLQEQGVKTYLAHENVYDQNTLSRLKLIGHVLSNNLNISYEKKTAILTLSLKDQKMFKMEKGDTEGLVNYGLSVSGVQLAVFVMEKENEVKFSFRSKGELDVNRIARNHFNGGGHKNAAGGSLGTGFEEALNRLNAFLDSSEFMRVVS